MRYACPAINADYQITFVPGATGHVQVVAAPSGCNSVSMTAAGLPQPGLLGGDATIALITRLMGAAVAARIG